MIFQQCRDYPQSHGGKLFEQTSTLLPDGQRDYVIEKRYDGTSSIPFSTTKIDWAYDDDGRLTQEKRDEGNDSIQNGGDYTDDYTLDLVGNRTKKVHDAVGTANDETIDYLYNNRDQLYSSGEPQGGGEPGGWRVGVRGDRGAVTLRGGGAANGRAAGRRAC